MHGSLYQTLIDDTLTYIKKLLHHPSPPLIFSQELPKNSPLPIKKEQSQKIAPPPTTADRFTNTKQKEDPFITLTPPTTPILKPTNTIKNLLLQIDPKLPLHDMPPNDLRARQIKDTWKRDFPAIPILFQEKSFLPFIMHIAQAIKITFATSCCPIHIKKGKDWNLFLQSSNIKTILAPQSLLFSTQELLPFYKETPSKKVYYLGNIPLLLLHDFSLYYKNPHLKRELWNVIIRHLQPLF